MKASQNQKYNILYGRLSQEDERQGESNSIHNHGKIYSVQMGELWENHFANYYFWNEPRHAYYFP